MLYSRNGTSRATVVVVSIRLYDKQHGRVLARHPLKHEPTLIGIIVIVS